MLNRIIAHLDMDAFFAAIEGRENPRFKGMPIVVGADPKKGLGRGIVSTANYQARKYGIHSAMPITRAWRLSEKAISEDKPKTIFLPVNVRLYSQVSDNIMAILQANVSQIEQASIDEAYMDFSFLGSYKKAGRLARDIKTEIKEKEELTASVGIGPNKLIAKIASSRNKPDGLTIIRPAQALDFLKPLSIREIPGIGPKTEIILNREKIFLIQDLQKMSRERLVELLGKLGADLYLKARGINDSEVMENHEIKSIGEQETFVKDTVNSGYINERLSKMASRIIRKMKSDSFQSYQTITLTVRFFDFVTKNRSHTLENPASDLVALKREAMKLLLPFFDRRENPNRKLIRLIGLRIEKLA